MPVETARRSHWYVGLTGPMAVGGGTRLVLLAGATSIKSRLKAIPVEETVHIRRFVLGALLTLAWIGFLLWFAASVVLAVM
jgi:hypothetical protein